MLIEVCANSLQSAINAEAAGADRIELCSELGVGGITPSYGLIKKVKEKVRIPVHVLVRPRSGHFTYTKTEFEVMGQDIEFCKELGVEGIVSGVLNKDFSVDVQRTKELVDLARPLKFVFHRAFDWVSNPEEAIKQLEATGVDTVLSSGQEATADKGLKKLRSWQGSTKNMTLMAGGGIHPDNAKKFKVAGLRALHLSGSSFGEAISIKDKISMNSQKHLNETQVAVTNVQTVRQIVQALK
ncbi:copper homeostasis protein CutC [Allomuricauda sp. SCSIO 65647]|uniref:copper homeostasis protein CutC n=1 Tax=Allomuricauda sp. SCSIO 65647 TaxID=2908843 RepID=UPI001F3E7394|nr:copper homeostasis protein CutC [Muricauda sp. SCSIO 65647]UJH68401.1 copper homeostasis protein CutC [Muricauda sp. SCSIO 65647]